MNRPSGPETERDLGASPPGPDPERGSGEHSRPVEAPQAGSGSGSDASDISVSVELVEAGPSTSRAAMLPRPDAVGGRAHPEPGRARRPGEADTLLSVPAPAETGEMETEDRVRLLERRVAELEARLGRVTLDFNAAGGAGRHLWAPWVIVLLLLLLLGQLLVRFSGR